MYTVYIKICMCMDAAITFMNYFKLITILQVFHADRKEKGWIEDDDDHQIIEFGDSSIKLLIPSEPIDNWKIVPRSHPEVID